MSFEDTKHTKVTKGTKGDKSFDALSNRVIGLAIDVHRGLGPGMLESVYEQCLCHELELAGLDYQAQVALPVRYKALTIPAAYRIDLLIEDELVVELKSVESLREVHSAQILSYMRLANKPVGLLINFNVSLLKRGVKRFVL